jgi:hypothetical protein
MNLLREYLRLILISEGRVEDLAKRNPNVDVQSLAAVDSTPTKKLLQWMIKQVSKGADVEHVKSVTSRFIKDGSRLPNKDIYFYSEIDDLEVELDILGASKRSETIQVKTGAVKIFEDKTCIVLRIDTKKAAQLYGRNTTWCITQENTGDYEGYKSENALFYFVIRKKQLKDNFDKVAVQVVRDDYNQIDDLKCYNQLDDQNDPISSKLSSEVIESIKFDAESQPYCLSDMILSWNNCKTFFAKMVFLIDRNFSVEDLLLELYLIEEDEDVKEILQDLIDKKAYIDEELDSIVWIKNGRLNRVGDKPALISASGKFEYWRSGKLHRDNDKPAVIDGSSKQWFKHGVQYEPKGL